MSARLIVPYTITWSNGTFTITWASVFSPISFSSVEYSLNAIGNGNYYTFGPSDDQLTFLDYTLCTNPTAGSRALLFTAVQALVLQEITNLTLNGTTTIDGTTNINTTGTSATNVGNSGSTTTVVGTTNLNATGNSSTNIGNTNSQTNVNGPMAINNPTPTLPTLVLDIPNGEGANNTIAFNDGGSNYINLIANNGETNNSIQVVGPGNTSAILEVDFLLGFLNSFVTIKSGMQFANGTSGYTATTYSYYEEITVTNSCSGPIASTAMNFKVTRGGNKVTVYFPGVEVNGNAVAAALSFSGVVPSRFLPSVGTGVSNLTLPQVIIQNGTTALGMIQMATSTGVLKAYGDAAGDTFTPSGSSTGLFACSIEWLI